MKLAVPDLISPSYFPAEAAIALGLFENEGLNVELELISPVERAYAALRDGDIDFVAGSAHSALSAFPRWRGVKLICAQSQGMYWFLVMRSDLASRRGDLTCVKGQKIGAAPWVGMGLRQLLTDAGLDLVKDEIRIEPMPGSLARDVNFGLAAARALEARMIDGFWANGMGAEVAVRSGAGTLVLDVRREGTKESFNYTMATIATTERFLSAAPEKGAAAVRAVAGAQRALIADPERATHVGRRLFPDQADLIAELIRRDLPYYRSALAPEFVSQMNRFARRIGILDSEVAYEEVVATRYRDLWT